MNRKMSIYDFTKPAELAAIATYAYFRFKQAKGYVLTDSEFDLLNGNVHTSQLGMILNSNRYYPYIMMRKNKKR